VGRKEIAVILVRLVFQTKWGKAQDVVDDYKQNADLMRQIVGPDVQLRILTDLSGPFHTVVQELEVGSLAEWERVRAAIFSNPQFRQLQARAESPFESGRAEFYTVEATIGAS
jgi:hypothetical protein